MENTGFTFLVGTAGSGKTVLSAVLRRYLQDQEIDVINVNLDPAVQRIPYTCEIDIRQYIDIQDLVDTYELGPNGAMITATDLIATEIKMIKEEIDDFEADSVIIDTPGQLEIFVYRSSGPFITREFANEPSACLFLMDGNLVRTPSSWISLNLLALSTQFRLKLPMVYALTKSDLLKEDEIDRLLRWNEDFDLTISDLSYTEKGLMHTLNLNLVETFKEISANVPLIPVSALNESGLEDLVANLSRIWRGGKN